jgi:hypothetical protein
MPRAARHDLTPPETSGCTNTDCHVSSRCPSVRGGSGAWLASRSDGNLDGNVMDVMLVLALDAREWGGEGSEGGEW